MVRKATGRGHTLATNAVHHLDALVDVLDENGLAGGLGIVAVPAVLDAPVVQVHHLFALVNHALDNGFVAVDAEALGLMGGYVFVGITQNHGAVNGLFEQDVVLEFVRKFVLDGRQILKGWAVLEHPVATNAVSR